MVLQSRRHVLCQDGKGRGCWGRKAQISSLHFTSPVWFQENARPISVVEPLPSPPGSPGEELLKSSLTRLRMGNAGSGDGLDATTKTAATHRGSSSSPAALPWLSVGQLLLQAEDDSRRALVASPFYGFAHSLFQFKP